MKTFLGWIPVLAVLAGCATPGPIPGIRHSSREAIVLGRVTVTYNGATVTARTSLVFQKRNARMAQYQPTGPALPTAYALDAAGLLAVRLPLGEYYLSRLRCRPPQWSHEANFNLAPDSNVFRLEPGHGTYYLGDINIRWTGPEKDPNAGSVLGLIEKAMADSQQTGTVCLRVEDRYARDVAAAEKRYGVSLAPENVLLEISDELAFPEEAAAPGQPGEEAPDDDLPPPGGETQTGSR